MCVKLTSTAYWNLETRTRKYCKYIQARGSRQKLSSKLIFVGHCYNSFQALSKYIRQLFHVKRLLTFERFTSKLESQPLDINYVALLNYIASFNLLFQDKQDRPKIIRVSLQDWQLGFCSSPSSSELPGGAGTSDVAFVVVAVDVFGGGQLRNVIFSERT